MAGILGGIFGLFGCSKKAPTKYETADVYKGLRGQVLELDPAKIGLSASLSNRVWGLLMETGYPEAVVTLVTIADGTVSLYFSNGGGIIGVGQHDGPRNALNDLLSKAPQFLPQAKPTKDFPLPNVGHTRFYFMTFDGVFTADAIENDLGNNRTPLSPLFHKAQEVITQARIADEKAQQAAVKMLHAATVGDAEDLTSLLKSGISADVVDHTGLTPLMASAFAGKISTLRVLLDSGAKIETTDASGYTALMFACNSGQTACADLLIERKADINRCDKESSTPLMFAAQHAHNDIVRLLLAHGADPEIKGKHGLSAIGFAKQNGHLETANLLINRK